MGTAVRRRCAPTQGGVLTADPFTGLSGTCNTCRARSCTWGTVPDDSYGVQYAIRFAHEGTKQRDHCGPSGAIEVIYTVTHF